jgi:hypothetical protein
VDEGLRIERRIEEGGGGQYSRMTVDMRWDAVWMPSNDDETEDQDTKLRMERQREEICGGEWSCIRRKRKNRERKRGELRLIVVWIPVEKVGDGEIRSWMMGDTITGKGRRYAIRLGGCG